MQIAKVVPKVRTKNEGVFDYAIPPELLPQIQPGVLTEIPFHGRQLQGIVIGIKRSSQISTLKSLTSIIDPNPVVDSIHIKLAKWLSDYYLEPFSKCLFENVVPVAKRKISNITASKIPTIVTNKFGYQYLVQGDFQYRVKIYLKAIEKTLTRKKHVIILVPDLEIVPFFTRQFKNTVSIIHAGLTRTQRYLEWQKIREGKINIVIGSNSALFSPLSNLGLIIIDQEENDTYKSNQSPRFHSVKVAEKLSELSGANLILGSITPRVGTYYKALNSKYKILKSSHLIRDRGLNTIVDMNSEKQILSLPLQKKIDEILENHKKILLVLNRKGEGTKFSCADCGWILKCEKCGLPLIPQKAEAVCYNCEKSFSLPESCPKCHGVHLKPLGVGTKRLMKFVKDFWPRIKTTIIEKDTIDNLQDFDIAIVTTYALKFSFSNIGLIGIIDADQSLNFPDFHSPEKTFVNYYKFLKIGEQGIVQTHLPENYVISALAGMNYEKFFLSELETRKKSQFPPFVHLTRLLYKNADEEICRRETEKISKLLISNLQSHISILGPALAFIKKERNKYRYQIIIKSQKTISHFSSLITIIRSLPKGWIVDVDPIDLL